MNKEMFVVIGCHGVSLHPNDTFICETSENEHILSEEKAKNLKNVFDKLYSKDYIYRVAKLTFLD